VGSREWEAGSRKQGVGREDGILDATKVQKQNISNSKICVYSIIIIFSFITIISGASF